MAPCILLGCKGMSALSQSSAWTGRDKDRSWAMGFRTEWLWLDYIWPILGDYLVIRMENWIASASCKLRYSTWEVDGAAQYILWWPLNQRCLGNCNIECQFLDHLVHIETCILPFHNPCDLIFTVKPRFSSFKYGNGSGLSCFTLLQLR